MATTTSKLTTTLPVSPIVPAGAGPAPQAGVVQVNLGAETGQVVTGGEFGLATTMGTPNWSYQSYADPAFQAVADQYPTDLLRHNWELNTQMDILFPSRGSVGKPDYSHIDNYLNQQGNLKGFFNNDTGTQIVTLGFPSWLNIGDPADQALYAGMVKGIAQHFIDKGEPIPNYELVNEPDGHANITDLAHTFNAVADALHSLDPGYKLGGLTESYVHSDDLKTFFGICGKNVGFVSWHQYVTGDSGSKSGQQEVTDSLNGAQSAGQAVRALMQASGIPDSVPLFLGEYNVDGGDYNDPANANMVGAVAAAATTYGMIHSNANFTMGALWDVQNDSAYSVFGHQGAYQVDPVGVVLADLTAYMPGNLVQTTMPGNTPGLVGYTTKSGAGFSTALINTSLSQGYTVDLGKGGLPTTGLYRVEVSAANPKGSRTALADLSHVSVAAGSVVIVTDEASHGGTELNGTTSTAPASAPAGTPDPSPAPPAAGGSTPVAQPAAVTGTAAAAGAVGPGSTSPSGSATQAVAGTSTAGVTTADPGKAAVPTTTAPPPSGAAVAPAATSAGNPTPASAGASGSGTGSGTGSTKPDQPSAASSGTAATPGGTTTGSAAAVQPAASTGSAATDPGSTGPSGSATQAMAGVTPTPFSASTGVGAAGIAAGASTPATPVAPTTDPAPATTASTNPNPTSAGGTTPPAAVGTGADTLVLNLSEDAYQGDAQFQLSVDGKAVGPAQGVTALHGKGQSEAFTFKGDWSGAHRFGVAFTNDAWGGSAGLDRNLYVDSATLNGTAVQGAAALYSNGAVAFGTPASQPPQAGATSQSGAVPAGTGSGGGTTPLATGAGSGGSATPAPVGTGADTLVLALSETAANGDAQFTLTIDGKPVGTAQGVTAAHGQGQPEAFAFKGDWSAGLHTVGVGFANPAAGSTADLARSLYLDSASIDGTPVEVNMQVTGNGPVTFALTPGAAPPAPADAAGAPADTLATTDDDGSAAAVPLVASGSHTDHPTGTGTVQQMAADGTDTITSLGGVKGEALTLGAGTRKLVLVNPRALVLTGGPGADTVAADSGANQFVAGTGSLDVTGGPGAAAYVLHSGGGALTVEDFDPAKGDTLTVDKALQGALVQASDGHGGTLLAFGAKQGSIDLISHATVSPSAIRFI